MHRQLARLALLLALASPVFAQEPCGALPLTGTFQSVAPEGVGLQIELDGDTLFLIDAFEPITSNRSGVIYAFERDASTGLWAETQRIPAPIDVLAFGNSTTVDGDTAVIGSRPEPVFGFPGRLFVYLRDPASGQWALNQTIVRPGTLAFPRVATLEGRTMAATLAESRTNGGRRVELWRRNPNGTYVPEAVLTPPIPLPTSDFGGWIEFIDEDRIVVSDSNAPVHSTAVNGQAYLYERDTNGAWTLVQSLWSSGGEPSGSYASLVWWDGQRLFVRGTSYNDPPLGNSGRVWDVYEFQGDFLSRRSSVIPDGGPQVSSFEYRGSETSVIAWFSASTSGNGLVSSLRPWVRESGFFPWFRGAPILEEDVLIGKTRTGAQTIEDSRLAYVRYDDLGGGVVQRTPFVAELSDGCGASGRRFCAPGPPNSTGASAALDIYASTLAAGLRLSAVGRDLPPSTACVVLAGPGPASPAPLGSAGNLCIHAPQRVGSVAFSNASGDLGRRISTASLPSTSGPVSAQAGETWSFQLWYRDGAASLLSSATSVVFE